MSWARPISELRFSGVKKVTQRLCHMAARQRGAGAAEANTAPWSDPAVSPSPTSLSTSDQRREGDDHGFGGPENTRMWSTPPRRR